MCKTFKDRWTLLTNLVYKMCHEVQFMCFFLFLQSIFSDKDQIRNLFTTFTLSNNTFFWHVLLKIISEHPDFWRGWRGYICRSIKAWKVSAKFPIKFFNYMDPYSIMYSETLDHSTDILLFLTHWMDRQTLTVVFL